jgi:cytoskeletal protein RodZ
MTDPNAAAAARARGQALRAARLARVRTIRRRVIAGAIALFVAAWLMITLVLVSGRDPALASHASTASSATTVASSPTVSTTSSGSTSASSTTSGGGGVSGVTTSQS